MVNAITWLNENYPTNGTCNRTIDTENCSSGNAKNRNEIENLDVSYQSLENELNLNDFTNLLKVNASYNKLASIIWGYSGINNVQEADHSHNRLTAIVDWKISGDSLKKFNLSSNSIANLTFFTPNLIHLDVSNNSLTKLALLNSPELNYLDVSDNALKELDLSTINDLQFLNCSNNRNLINSSLTKPNNFIPLIVDCFNTSLSNITFSNSSVFDCKKGRLISGNTTSTTTSTPTSVSVSVVTATSQPTSDLALNLGLGLGIPLAVIFLGLTAFFGYKLKKSLQAIPTAGSS